MLKVLTVSALGLIAAALPASATTLLAYDTVNGASVPSLSSHDTITGADLTRGAGVTQNVGGDFNSRGWTENDLFNAVLNEDYLEWGASSTDDFTLLSMDIAYDRSPTGPMSLSLFASVDNGSFASIFTDTSIDVSGEVNSIDLTATILDFENISDVTFRLFGWGATNAAGTFDVETGNVGPNGQFGLSIIGVVPLPAGLPLLASGLALLGLSRRRA